MVANGKVSKAGSRNNARRQRDDFRTLQDVLGLGREQEAHEALGLRRLEAQLQAAAGSAAMSIPGVILSQFEMQTMASAQWAFTMYSPCVLHTASLRYPAILKAVESAVTATFHRGQ